MIIFDCSFSKTLLVYFIYVYQKLQDIPKYWSDKCVKDTVVNRALPFLHGGSLEITLTVPLKGWKSKREIVPSKFDQNLTNILILWT